MRLQSSIIQIGTKGEGKREKEAESVRSAEDWEILENQKYLGND
jgi:hypothetical protein